MTNSNCLFMLFRELMRPLETVVKFWKHIWGKECVWSVGLGAKSNRDLFIVLLFYFRGSNCFFTIYSQLSISQTLISQSTLLYHTIFSLRYQKFEMNLDFEISRVYSVFTEYGLGIFPFYMHFNCCYLKLLNSQS